MMLTQLKDERIVTLARDEDVYVPATNFDILHNQKLISSLVESNDGIEASLEDGTIVHINHNDKLTVRTYSE